MARPMTWLTSTMLIVLFAVLASAQQPLQSPPNNEQPLQPESEDLIPMPKEETVAGPRRVTLQDEEILPGPNDQGQDLVRNRRTFGSIFFSKGYHHGYYRPRYYYSSWGPRYYSSYYQPYYYSHY